MVAKPGSAPDHTLNPDVEKTLGVKGVTKLKATPETTRVDLTTTEHETLDNIQTRDRSWWQRVGRLSAYAVPFPGVDRAGLGEFGNYKMKIRQKASEEAIDLLDNMDDLSNSTLQRLKWRSLKSAKRFAEVTSRINVASRTISGIHKQRELMKESGVDFRGLASALRQQGKSDHPIRTSVTLVRDRLFPKDYDLGIMGNDKLLRAAQEVKSEETVKRREWESTVEGRLGGARKAENHLRSLILRHSPEKVTTIEDELRKCAAGETGPIEKTIADLKFLGVDPASKTRKDVLQLLETAVKTLSGRSGGMAKAFEVAGRIELTGSTTEILNQVRSMPLGTRLSVTLPDYATDADMVLEAKQPDNYLILKPVSGDRRLAIDLKQQAAWMYAIGISKEHKEADKVGLAVRKVAKKGIPGVGGLSATADVRALWKAAQDAMVASGATAATVKKDVDTVLMSLSPAPDPKLKDAILKAAEDTAKGFLKAPRTAAVSKKTPEAREIDFNQIRFSYPEV